MKNTILAAATVLLASPAFAAGVPEEVNNALGIHAASTCIYYRGMVDTRMTPAENMVVAKANGVSKEVLFRPDVISAGTLLGYELSDSCSGYPEENLPRVWEIIRPFAVD